MTSRILGPRDMTNLTILAEMYGAPLDLIARLNSVSNRSAYRMAQRWRDCQMVCGLGVRPVPGPTWIVPTRSTAGSLLGTEIRHWAPSPGRAAHVSALFALRAALTGLDLNRWISERLLHAEIGANRPGQQRPYINHGRYTTSSGELWAVHVELSATKSVGQARSTVFRAYQAALAAGCVGLRCYCRGESVNRTVEAAVANLDLPWLYVTDLDEFLAGAPERRRLTLVTGGTATEERDGAASL